VTGQWFSLGTPISSTNKTDCHDRTEIFCDLNKGLLNISPDKSFVRSICPPHIKKAGVIRYGLVYGV
jgi:hypothetical protein